MAELLGVAEKIGDIDMGLSIGLEPVDITILTYDIDKDTKDIEVFWLRHGAEHRMAELIEEFGDTGNWGHSLIDGKTTAKNDNLGGIIQIFTRRVQEGGSKS